MRRVSLLLLGLLVGALLAGFAGRATTARLADVESELAEVREQLRGIEGSLTQIPPRPDEVRVGLSRVARLIDPVDAAPRPGEDALYVATRPGRVFRVDLADREVAPALAADISELVDTQGAKTGLGGEAGLLALAFSSGGDLLYLTYTGLGTPDEDSVEWTLVELPMDGTRADAGRARTLLEVAKRFPHHNGGDIAFGPDGYLYTSIGDGAPYGDLNQTGQDPNDLLGSILRIDPRPSADRPYSIPEDNPFADGGGAPEVWAYGVRNPWRFAFDRITGDLWIGDVGDREEEEIDLLRAVEGGGRGANLGWSVLEGTHLRGEEEPEDHVPPVHTYRRRRPFCALIGGYPYRGSRIPALRGAYLYSDYCDGTIRTLVLEAEGPRERSLGIEVVTPSSFAEGRDGELYVVSLKGDVYRIEPA